MTVIILKKIDPENLFMARDEIIDAIDDTTDWVMDVDDRMPMKQCVLDSLSNSLKLLEELRISLGIPDRNYNPDS